MIFGGPRGGYGGRRGGNYPGGGGGGYRTQSAGTSEIARNSGGDSLSVDDASALDTTLSRIRQRYALHFTVPDGARSGQERNVEVSLAANILRRYPDAEVRYRHTYVTPEGNYGSASPAESAPPPAVVTSNSGSTDSTDSSDNPGFKRRRMVSDPDSPRGPIGSANDSQAGSSSTPAPAAETQPASTQPAATQPAATPPASTQPATGGWRKLKPGEKP